MFKPSVSNLAGVSVRVSTDKPTIASLTLSITDTNIPDMTIYGGESVSFYKQISGPTTIKFHLTDLTLNTNTVRHIVHLIPFLLANGIILLE